jgi:hypothetical protein
MLHAYEEGIAQDVPGSLHWHERSDGHWLATSPSGGHYELIPKDGEVQVWYMGRNVIPEHVSTRSTLGGGMASARKHLSDVMYPSRAAEDPCSHSHPEGVPTSPCPDPSAHAPTTEIESTRITKVTAERTRLRASEGGGRKVIIACEKPIPASAAAKEVSPYARNTRDPKEIEEGRALGPCASAADVYRIVGPSLSKESQEVFLVLPIDLRGQLQCKPVEVARGQMNRVTVNKSDIFRPVIHTNAMGFLVVHVHPSGHCRPSPEDKRLTASICKAVQEGALDSEVKFVDHVIVASSAKKGEYYSFRENGHITHRCTWVSKTAKALTVHKVAHAPHG